MYALDELKKLTDIEVIGLLFKTRHRKLMDLLVERDENLMEIKKIYEELTNDKDFLDEYTKEELEKFAYGEETYEKGVTLGIEQGSNEQKQEIAKKMLEINIPMDDIVKCTGLTKEEIEKL